MKNLLKRITQARGVKVTTDLTGGEQDGSFTMTINVCDEDQESSPLDIVFRKYVDDDNISYGIEYPKSVHVASDIIYNLILVDYPGPWGNLQEEIKKKTIVLDRKADQKPITFDNRKYQ